MADPHPAPPAWQPTHFEELVDGPFATSMGTALVETDAGPGYLKALGNPEGPHALAREFVGSSLARWFGLAVPDFAILQLDSADCLDYPPPKGGRMQSGPAFISRAVPGRAWGGEAADLAGLENPDDVTRLVVFDTWIRNRDRHPADLTTWKPNYANVLLAKTDSVEGHRLCAIDHTHCFAPGADLTKKLADLANIRDDGVYGLFPAFSPHVRPGVLEWCKADLAGVKRDEVAEIVGGVPAEWEVPAEVRAAWVKLIVDRAAFLVNKIESGWRLRP